MYRNVRSGVAGASILERGGGFLMRHLVIGGSGQVGSHLVRVLAERGDRVWSTYRSNSREGAWPLDMTREEEVARVLGEVTPEVVWLPAALPDVDRCEREPDLSRLLNVEAVATVGRRAAEEGARLVFYSTDYVFDGTRGPYREDDAPNPLQVYGRHKLEAERFILANLPRALIIRTAWVYSQEDNPRNFLYRLRCQVASGQAVRAAIDQISTPTDADDLARRSVAAVDRNLTGVLHLAGPRRLSRYQWTLEVARSMGAESRVEAIRTHELGLFAARPLDGGIVTVRE